MFGGKVASASLTASSFVGVGLPVLASVLIAVGAVLSLVTIISIYREGGILKRLRATPLHPETILSAHVIVKLTAHRGHAGLNDAGRQTLLSGGHSCSDGSVSRLRF